MRVTGMRDTGGMAMMALRGASDGSRSMGGRTPTSAQEMAKERGLPCRACVSVLEGGFRLHAMPQGWHWWGRTGSP